MAPTDATPGKCHPLENGHHQTHPFKRQGLDGLAGTTAHELARSPAADFAIAQFSRIGARYALSKLRCGKSARPAHQVFHTRPPSPVNSRLQKLPP